MRAQKELRGKSKAKHVVRSQARKVERKKRVEQWSAQRPKREDADMTIVQQLGKLLDGGSAFDQADKTGLSKHTIYRFRNGKVYEPRARTLQMIAKANGGRMVFIKDN